jgi:hypothetical protein
MINAMPRNGRSVWRCAKAGAAVVGGGTWLVTSGDQYAGSWKRASRIEQVVRERRSRYRDNCRYQDTDMHADKKVYAGWHLGWPECGAASLLPHSLQHR